MHKLNKILPSIENMPKTALSLYVVADTHYKKSRYFRRPKTAENKRLPPKTGNFRRLLANFRRDLDAGNGQPKISTIFGGPAES